jgi:hypothetical protein
MDRQEAERIYEAGRETVIAVLLAMDARIKEMEQVVARLTRNSSNSSRPPSSDPPGLKNKSSKPAKRRVNAVRAVNRAIKARNGNCCPPRRWMPSTTFSRSTVSTAGNRFRKACLTLRDKPCDIRSLNCPLSSPSKQSIACTPCSVPAAAIPLPLCPKGRPTPTSALASTPPSPI